MKIKLIGVRGAFLKLYQAEQVNGEGKPRFGAAFVIDPANAACVAIETAPGVWKTGSFALIDQALNSLAEAQWKTKGAGILKQLVDQGRVCFLKRPKANSSGEVYDGFEGMYHLNAGRDEEKGRPIVIDQNKAPLTAADGKPYSGCYLNASLELWAQDNKWGKRINATLMGVQFVRDGDAFSGGSKPSMDDFDAIEEGATADDLA